MKVLIADDESISRRLLQNYLEKWGYQVVVAENGRRAWEIFQDGDFRMVISDWLMPEMDGLDLVRHIRARPSPNYVYAILVTVRAQKEDLVEAMEAGADDFICKPFDRDELRVRLREGERIIQLQQTLADQSQRLAQADRVLSEGVESEARVSMARCAATLREPFQCVRESVVKLQALVPRLTQIEEALRQSGTAELGALLGNLAAECALGREAIERELADCDQQLQQITDLLQSFAERPEK
jgi:CheY-like chemotaxis protein